jgi:hypothetical protein
MTLALFSANKGDFAGDISIYYEARATSHCFYLVSSGYKKERRLGDISTW